MNKLTRNVSQREAAAAKSQGRKPRGRAKTDAYLRWLRAAETCMMAHPKPLPRFEGRVALSIWFGEIDAQALDENNCTKAPIDFLVSKGIMPDDSLVHIRGTATCWVKNFRGTLIKIEPDPAEASAEILAVHLPSPVLRLMEQMR